MANRVTLYIFFQIMLIVWIDLACSSRLYRGTLGRSRGARDVSCRESLGYTHDGMCCLKCPAGTYVKEHCSETFQRGSCEPCGFDTYTEHDNGLNQCLWCTKCRSDQESVKRCTSTQDTECRCKAGFFCPTDQACEVCKRCGSCKEDEVEVKNCTPTSNTDCEKKTAVGAVVGTVLVAGLCAVFAIVVACYLNKKRPKICKNRGMSGALNEVPAHTGASQSLVHTQNQQNEVLNTQCHLVAFVMDDDDIGLGGSLSSTASSSQNNLTSPSNPPLRRTSVVQPSARVTEDPLPRLIPCGDEALRQSFELFEEVDVNYHNRFFRHIGVSDNAIISADLSGEKVYHLLKIWMEKEGMKADINDLIDALVYLGQRMSAENIVSKAVDCGYFTYEIQGDL
ncbi:tumor necrosis factor receptor superfamily member 10B-like [Denticeps clupeoides]|uniref:tumor necrosis factor receptor superfamily member 10B-like n=1 Tax=Denticeps clupeoides TaxID=299321 RepID=UPI0010A4C7DA|nr:tumor necrosis factor receptor superfamily member 10B-like [Denticeps clupeoides]